MQWTCVKKNTIKASHVGPIFNFSADHHISYAALEVVTDTQSALRFEIFREHNNRVRDDFFPNEIFFQKNFLNTWNATNEEGTCRLGFLDVSIG